MPIPRHASKTLPNCCTESESDLTTTSLREVVDDGRGWMAGRYFSLISGAGGSTILCVLGRFCQSESLSASDSVLIRLWMVLRPS